MQKKLLLLLLPVILTATSCDGISFSIGGTSSSSPSSEAESTYSDDYDDYSEEDSSYDDEEEESSYDDTSEEDSSSSSSVQQSGWVLSWSDEFEGTSLDTSNWEYMIGDGSSYGVQGWGNSEEQYYRSDNGTVEDGNLVITAKRESYNGYSYTSARIRSKGKVSTTYGKIEARIKLPSGTGLWPAFWMLPENSYESQGWPHSGEIDIMEAKGRVTNQSSSALHYSDDNNNHIYQTATNYLGFDTIEDYHTYGVEWTYDSMVFYCDDNEFLTVTRDQWQTDAYASTTDGPFDQPFHILINMAVGGSFDSYNSPDSSFESASMYVDYVRIYDWVD